MHGDGESGYVMQRAAERLESRQSDFASSGSDGSDLEEQAAIYHRDEAFLMTAGFLFAIVVAAIIAIDQFGSRSTRPSRMRSRAVHRWQYGMLLAGAIALPIGVGAARRLRRGSGAHGTDPGRTRGDPHRRVGMAATAAPGAGAGPAGCARPTPQRAAAMVGRDGRRDRARRIHRIRRRALPRRDPGARGVRPCGSRGVRGARSAAGRSAAGAARARVALVHRADGRR